LNDSGDQTGKLRKIHVLLPAGVDGRWSMIDGRCVMNPNPSVFFRVVPWRPTLQPRIKKPRRNDPAGLGERCCVTERSVAQRDRPAEAGMMVPVVVRASEHL
jgi:hypothetical protein